MASAKTVTEPTLTRMPSCTRCGKNDAAPGGDNNWCAQCRAEYQRKYQQDKSGVAVKRGFAIGVRETKECLAREFDRLRISSFTGEEIAHLIRQAPGPKFPEETTNPTQS